MAQSAVEDSTGGTTAIEFVVLIMGAWRVFGEGVARGGEVVPCGRLLELVPSVVLGSSGGL